MAEENKHPLLLKEKIRKIENWDEWLLLWGKTEIYEELLDLLDVGFTLEDNRAITPDSVCFYLEVAYGYRDEVFFGGYNQFGGNHLRRMRQELARKAMKMLYQHFFQNTKKECPGEYIWHRLVTVPLVFHKLLWFFIPSQVLDRGNIPRFITPTPEEEIIHKFLKEFCLFVFNYDLICQDNQRVADIEVRQMFIENRPKILELMDATKNLELLIDTKCFGKNGPSLDAASMFKLEDLAMTENKNRQGAPDMYESLVEAIFAGSQAASVLVILKIKQRERVRREQIQEAEVAKAEAEQKLEVLKSNKTSSTI